MEEIINKVIEIDTFAKNYIKSAEKRKINLEDYITQQKAFLKNQSETILENDLKKEQNKIQSQVETKTKEIKAQEQQELDKLDNFLNQNKENLVQQIYNEIITE
ncbi:MAG: hypothetical protein FWF46_01080 [Oscillospiraceae bacterium]|nr:hypothetical protein [Oscillospiraceae bacterium]